MEASTNFKTVSEQIKNMQNMDKSILPATMVTSPSDILSLMAFCKTQLTNASGDDKSKIEARVSILEAIIDQKLQITALALGLNGDSVAIVPTPSLQTVIEFAEEPVVTKDNVIKHDFVSNTTVKTTEELAAIAGETSPLTGMRPPLKDSAKKFGLDYTKYNTVTKAMEIYMGNNAPTMWNNPLYWNELSEEKTKAFKMRIKSFFKVAGIDVNDFNVDNAQGIPTRIYNFEPISLNAKGDYLNKDGKVVIPATPLVDAETNLSTPVIEDTVEVLPTEFFKNSNRSTVDLTTLPEEIKTAAIAADSVFKVNEVIAMLVKAELYEQALNYAIDSLTDLKNAYKGEPFTREDVEKRFMNEDLPMGLGNKIVPVENMGSFTLATWVEKLKEADATTTHEQIVANAEEEALKLAKKEKLVAITTIKDKVRNVLTTGSGSAMNIARSLVKGYRKFKLDIDIPKLVSDVKAEISENKPTEAKEQRLLFKPINIEKEHPDVWESAKLEKDLVGFTELIKTIVFEKNDKFESPWMVAANLVEQHINVYEPTKSWNREQKTAWFKNLVQKTTERRKEDAAKAKALETTETVSEEVVLGPAKPEILVTEPVIETKPVEPIKVGEAVIPNSAIVEKYKDLTKEPVTNEVKRWIEKFLLDPIAGSSIVERGKALIPMLHMHKKWKKAPNSEILNFINATIRNSKNVEFKDIILA